MWNAHYAPLCAVPVQRQRMTCTPVTRVIVAQRPDVARPWACKGHGCDSKEVIVVARTDIGRDHNAPLRAVPVLNERLSHAATQAIAVASVACCPYIGCRDGGNPQQAIVARACVLAHDQVPLRAVPVLYQSPVR